jgi:hypothetical protein
MTHIDETAGAFMLVCVGDERFAIPAEAVHSVQKRGVAVSIDSAEVSDTEQVRLVALADLLGLSGSSADSHMLLLSIDGDYLAVSVDAVYPIFTAAADQLYAMPDLLTALYLPSTEVLATDTDLIPVLQPSRIVSLCQPPALNPTMEAAHA